MFGMIPLAGVVLTFVVLTLVSESFGFAVSRVMEAAFDAAEYRLALRARRRAERIKARRREGRRRAARLSEAVSFTG
jgi:hypothetical protein